MSAALIERVEFDWIEFAESRCLSIDPARSVTVEGIRMVSNRPCVSILMPVYNAERYLRECLDSVAGQTFRDFEAICVNDGSTDESLFILEAYAARDDRFKVISRQNGGYGKAMNVALSHATGEYIGIVEPDDLIAPNMLEGLYRAAKENDCDIVRSNRIDFSEEGDVFVEMHEPSECGVIFSPRERPHCFLKAPATWSGLYRRALLRDNGIRYSETPGAAYQDTGFSFQTWAFADRACLLHDAYYKYRRDNANSSTNSRRKIFDICTEYQLLRSSLEDKGVFAEHGKAFCACMFKGYMWSYGRVDWLYRYAFLLKASDDFRTLARDGYLDGGLLPEQEQRRLSDIVSDPERYFEADSENCSYFKVIESLETQRSALREQKGNLERRLVDAEKLIAQKERETSLLELRNRELEDEALSLGGELRASEDKAAVLTKKVEALKASNSYRIGRAVTYIPRWVKRTVKRLLRS